MLNKYIFKKKPSHVYSNMFSTSRLLECMNSYAAQGYECYTTAELAVMLRTSGTDIPIALLEQMIDALVGKGYVQRTVHGNIQLAN